MRPVCTAIGWEDYLHWQSADHAVLKRVDRLFKTWGATRSRGSASRSRFVMPWPVRGPGAWSRRIDSEHRRVYVLERDDIAILTARHHYRWRS